MSLLEAHEFSPAGAGSMDVAKDYVIGWSVTFGYSGGPIQKTILMPANPTVGQLRWAAGNAIGYPANKVR